ncbi:uncharacterized protein LOC100575580 [Acyrthosiphon pisum]|uniref:Uncharacterized protein n=1 Tax=Acyrthosiphon pisum TaxID=7029 RepID=A0A8R1W4I2_ACYPI|nr:uncharacterized protein LOC100575580 [Acyrthosiphon pisum]|eukprot:XP_003240148.1 PREDICTED: uncharacterized protein LOC100575580 [Acyrthosiphon pisum]
MPLHRSFVVKTFEVFPVAAGTYSTILENMDARKMEFQKLLSVNKTVNKMQENIVRSTMKLYRQKSLPYKLVRDKPVKARTVKMSNSCGQSLAEIKVERIKLLQKLMNITETVHRMRDQLIKTKMELYRRKKSPYEWTRECPKKFNHKDDMDTA